MTQAPIQTLVVGTPPVEAWSKSLGFTTQFTYPLSHCFGLLVGEQNCGKSYILQSNPKCFIINTDLSSTVRDPCLATVWPGLRGGSALGVDNQTFILGYLQIESVIQQLCLLARENKPRPETVAVDTLNTLIPLLKPYIVQRLGKSRWEECHGPQAYDLLYGVILEIAQRLRNHGYGFWYTVHLSRKWENISETSGQEAFSLLMGEGLRERLTPLVEWVVPVVANRTVQSNRVATQVRKPDGSIGPPTFKEVPTVVTSRVLAFNDPRMMRVVRTRTTRPMPDVDITNSTNPWDTFVEAFEKCSTPTPLTPTP